MLQTKSCLFVIRRNTPDILSALGGPGKNYVTVTVSHDVKNKKRRVLYCIVVDFFFPIIVTMKDEDETRGKKGTVTRT